MKTETLLTKTKQKKAVAYYRHSAEDKQENSVAIQRDHAVEFAEKYNIEIIHEESDEGVSGLIANRPGYDALFENWILNEESQDFDYVLVYDVSRWGRFQDPDEAAYYEMQVKKRGKQVIYITRGFPKEEQKLLMSLQTPIERYMAAEYSRQLSEKVFHGSMKISEQGFSAGGSAPYGMTRVLLDEQKQPVKQLKKGEHKVIANQRVSFAPAQDETAEIVQRIYKMFTKDWQTTENIAEILNDEGLVSANGGAWNKDKVFRILTNETYIGTRLYNKTSSKLKSKQINNPRNEWVVKPNAFEGLVNENTFYKTQENLYWLMPTKRRRGSRIIRRVHKTINSHLKDLLDRAGMSLFKQWWVLRELPIAFGVTTSINGEDRWCFVADESFKQFEHMLCVSRSHFLQHLV